MASDEEKVTVKKTPKRRKKSPRGKTNGRIKNPAVSVHMKALWADPVWAAKMREKRRTQDRSKISRIGVPDGMRKHKAEKLWAKARKSASKTMTELRKVGVLDGADPRAEEALETAVSVMRSPLRQEMQLAAARLVLDFLKAKPATKTDLTINKAEQWLASLASDDEQDGPAEDTATPTN